jgi:hypothetical protein
MSEKQVIIVKGGGCGSVFMGLVAFFIVLPIVATIGCFACVGTFTEAVHKARIEAEQEKEKEAEAVKQADNPRPVFPAQPQQFEPPAEQQSRSVSTEPEPKQLPPTHFEPHEPETSTTSTFSEPIITRTWHDKHGHKVEADYDGMVDGKVLLKKANGKTVKIPVSKLSDEDQEWLKLRKIE